VRLTDEERLKRKEQRKLAETQMKESEARRREEQEACNARKSDKVKVIEVLAKLGKREPFKYSNCNLTPLLPQ